MVKYYYDWGVFMYKKKNRAKQHQMQFITLDDLVPADHILRLIDDAIDFSFIYDEVEGLYASGRDGRPGIDPVSLLKIIFIQYLFGIRSMRQTIKEIEVNTAYRWFIGYELLEPIPQYKSELDQEIDNDRSQNGKKPFDCSYNNQMVWENVYQ